jgi:hypothetical protein
MTMKSSDTHLSTAKAHAGVNTALTDDQAYDVASGTAVLFGTPVTVEPAEEIEARRPPDAGSPAAAAT